MTRSIFLLLLAVSVLFSMGLIMVFNTTSAEMIDRNLNLNIYFPLIKQFCYAILGLIVCFVIWKIGYLRLLDLSPSLLLLTIALLVFVFFPFIGQEINGAKRWLGFLGYTFQPSEIAKYVIPMYFIYGVVQKKGLLKFKDFFFIMCIITFPIGLILLEPDNGTIAFVMATMVVLFLLTRIRWTFWALPLLCLSVVGGCIAFNMPHVPDRIRVYLHPEADIRGKGHQPYQAKIASGSGRLFGRGLGESLQKLNYLPEARSDYIAAIFAEEFGFVGICFLIGLYMVLSYAGFSVAFSARDRAGFYLASIFTFVLVFQAFLNLGVVSGLLPSKGMTLPFFSQGGSSLVINMAAVAFLVNIAYSTKKQLYAKQT